MSSSLYEGSILKILILLGIEILVSEVHATMLTPAVPIYLSANPVEAT